MTRKRRKRLEAWEQYAEDRRRRQWAAPTLSEQHPDVRELRLELSFLPHDAPFGPPRVTPVTYVLTADRKGFFEVDCRDGECICGGFDLTGPITQMLAARAQECEGRLVCDGWEDTERYKQHRCMMQLTYRVSAIYG